MSDRDYLDEVVREATHRLLNDRAEIGYHDDIRPYIRLRNYILRVLDERRALHGESKEDVT